MSATVTDPQRVTCNKWEFTSDAELAVKWLTVAAENHDPVGQRNLAAACFKGWSHRSNCYGRMGALSFRGKGPAGCICIPFRRKAAARWSSRRASSRWSM